MSEKNGLRERVAMIAALPFNFWISNFMEVLERLAFFSTRAIAPLYLVVGSYRGGLGLSYTQKSIIFMVWALIQCLVPMVSGGYTERYGYRKSLAVAFFINICGYVLMGFSGGFWAFFAAGCLVGFGTAIFKPPVQGTIARSTTPSNSSVAWGMFYLVVNIGGFIAPFMAAGLRGDTNFRAVFFVAALVTALNYLPAFLLYREPEKAGKEGEEEARKGVVEVFLDSIGSMFKDAHLVVFLLIFSGFWFMFMQLFDTLPNFVDEWVDTSDVAPYFSSVPLLGRGTVYKAPKLERVDLAKEIPSWAKDFQGALERKGVKVEAAVKGRPLVLAFKRDVKSLAEHMVRSAAAALPGKGSVRLRAGVDREGRVFIALSLPPGAPQGRVLAGITDPGTLVSLAKGKEGGKKGGKEGMKPAEAASLWSHLYLARVIGMENGFPLSVRKEKGGGGTLYLSLGKALPPLRKGEKAGPMPSAGRKVHLREDRVGQTKAEMIMNIDTFSILLFMIPIAAFTGLLPPMVSLILGMVISLVGFLGAGYSPSGVLACLMIFVFALGEMTCSPKFSEFIGLIAPPDKKALYMGYSNMPFAIGWAGGNFLAGPLYDALSKKASLARDYLVTHLHFPGPILEKADPQAMIPLICEKKGFSHSDQVTRLLWDTYDPQRFWAVMGAVGLVSILGIIGFYFHARKSGWGKVEG